MHQFRTVPINSKLTREHSKTCISLSNYQIIELSNYHIGYINPENFLFLPVSATGNCLSSQTIYTGYWQLAYTRHHE